MINSGRILKLMSPFILTMTITCYLSSCKSPLTKVVTKHKNGNPAIVADLPDRRDTLNYTVRIYFSDGQLKRIAQVTNGKYSGVIKTYYESGKLSQLDSLINPCSIQTGACDETCIRFYENGVLSERFSVKEGECNGLSQHFGWKGQLAKEYYLVDDSIKNGSYREFYDDGKILRSATYHMDTLVGYEYIFKENGDTVKYYSHYNGQMDFPYKIWLGDGGSTAYGTHLNGDTVLWTWYDQKGNIIKKQTAVPSKSGYVVPH